MQLKEAETRNLSPESQQNKAVWRGKVRRWGARLTARSDRPSTHLYAEDRPTDCDQRSAGSVPRSNNHVGNNESDDAGAGLKGNRDRFRELPRNFPQIAVAGKKSHAT